MKIVPSSRFQQHTLRAILTASLTLGVTAVAAPIVDWGGDYVTSEALSSDMSGRAGDYSVLHYGTWKYDGSSRSSPGANYTAPAGKSDTFYWGSWLYRNENAVPSWRNWSNAFVRNDGANDRIEFYRHNSTAGTQYTGASFVAFLKEDFLNDYDTAAVSFSDQSSIRLTAGRTAAVTYRFAILADEQWYVSQTSRTDSTDTQTEKTFTLEGDDLLNSLWGLWDPTGGSADRLGSLPTTFNTTGASFSDIQGFGIYIDFHPDIAALTMFQINSFTVDQIPEPGTTALLLGSAAFVGLRSLRRRRKTSLHSRIGAPAYSPSWRSTASALCIGISLATPSVEAKPVIDWGGEGETIPSGPLIPADPTYLYDDHQHTRIWDWDPSRPISPAVRENYTGRSTTFHGAGWLEATAREPASKIPRTASLWSVLSVLGESTGSDPTPLLRIYRGGSEFVDYQGAFFIAFLPSDLLDNAAERPQALGSAGTLALKTHRLNSAEIRFALLVGSRWYVHETAYTKRGEVDLSGPALLQSHWAEWSPTRGAAGRLAPLPESFTIPTANLGPVEGAGLLVSFKAAAPKDSLWCDLQAFRVDLGQ